MAKSSAIKLDEAQVLRLYGGHVADRRLTLKVGVKEEVIIESPSVVAPGAASK